jgi:NADH-quinone oxidoreductase subunit B
VRELRDKRVKLLQQDHGRHTHHPIRPLVLDFGCCGVSAAGLGWPRIDAPGSSVPGLGDLFLGSGYDLEPEQATVLIVAGRLTRALAPLVRTTYEQMAASCRRNAAGRHAARYTQSAWVIAYGTCALSGAVFDTPPLEQICPVDIAVPGCPPHLDALWQALLGVFCGSEQSNSGSKA